VVKAEGGRVPAPVPAQGELRAIAFTALGECGRALPFINHGEIA
jgi:hypothetical protein